MKTLLLVLLCSLSAQAADLPWDGMLRELPASFSRDIASDPRFLSFTPMQIGQGTPLGTNWMVDGVTYPGTASIMRERSFRERHWVALPDGARIRVKSTGPHREEWALPPGSRLVHEVRWRAEGEPLFELRMIEKRADGTWAFGIYLTQEDGSLRLAEQLQFELETQQVRLEAGRRGDTRQARGETSVFQFKRISPKTCVGCHKAVAPQPDGIGAEKHVGACGFAPQNAGLKAWREAYEAKFGHSPFVAE